ncbi:MAG: PQQ-binding-like beta-propeller repeat protein [Pirellulales bacterium]
MVRFLFSVVVMYACGWEVCRVGVADWPQFRGPTGDGHARTQALPIRWSESQNVIWKVPVPGLGWSSPVVKDGRIYVTTAVPRESESNENSEGHSLELVCFRAQDGKLIFRKALFEQTGPVQMHKKNSHASPTPLLHNNNIFVHFGPHGTACTTLDGEVVWTCVLPYEPQHGNGGSPVLADGVLVICCDGKDVQYVVGLNPKTGEQVWKTNRDTKPKKGFSFGTPLWLPASQSEDQRDQVICPGSDAVFSYNPRNGKELWRFDYPNGYSVIPRPVFGHGLVYICSGYDKPSLFAIRPTGRGNVTETHGAWMIDQGAPHTPSLLLHNNEIYLVSDRGIATCLDARTGGEHWRERLGGNFSASPFLAGDNIYFQNETGEAIVIKAGTTYQEVSRNEIGDGDRTFASYAVEGNHLLLRSETSLYALGTN